MLPHDCSPVAKSYSSPSVSGLEEVLRVLSVVTMFMTVPQLVTIWVGRDASGVSLVSCVSYLFSTCLWFVYGPRGATRRFTSLASVGCCSTWPS
jgi:hypothetical protein